MIQTIRGGVPWIWRGNVGSTPQSVPFATGNCNYLKVRSTGADVRIYFGDKNTNLATSTQYVVCSAGSVWEGPADVGGCWLMAPSGTAAVELCAFVRFN